MPLQSGASAREEDMNGFVEIAGNPLSKVGVFEYSGAQISPDLEPNRIYKVHRPESSLNNEETINSFRLLPWTDEHMMLSGKEEDGLMDAVHKGVHGIVGEQVYFEHPYLKANIKIFSQTMGNLINDGKRELSIGYRCIYEAQNGEYDGEQYDFLQTNIIGNHLALVQEGRSGHDVSVLDHKFTFTLDTKDLKMGDMSKEDGDLEKPADAKDNSKVTLDECFRMIKALQAKVNGKGQDEFEDDLEAEKINESENMTEDEVEPEDFVKRAEGVDAEEDLEKESKAEDEDMDKPDEKKESAMDSKTLKHVMSQISARDVLAKKLAAHIGTFDHANKTVDEVAQYGVRKLGLSCDKGAEKHVLSGYLAGAKVSSVAIAQDNKIASGCVDAYLKGA